MFVCSEITAVVNVFFNQHPITLCYWLPGEQYKPEECPTHTSLMKLLLHCSWPGQVEWWCEALQLHSEELLCQFKGGAEADKCRFLPALPPCPALWRELRLRDSELEILHLRVRENSEKISRGIFILSLWYNFNWVQRSFGLTCLSALWWPDLIKLIQRICERDPNWLPSVTVHGFILDSNSPSAWFIIRLPVWTPEPPLNWECKCHNL